MSIFDIFSEISGYKISWANPALLPLSDAVRQAVPPPNIPVVYNFRYLGIPIFSSLQAAVSNNYNSILKQMEVDLGRWASIPNSFQARASVIKMNILPRVNFCSFMLPLPPPAVYWDKIHKVITYFVSKGKHPRIKMSILQRLKCSGGLGLSNFKFYSWPFTLLALHTWLNPDAQLTWRPLEEELVGPHRLQDIIYSNISLKTCRSSYSPIISNLIATWGSIESHGNIHLKYHPHFPLFNNFVLCFAGRPI